MAAPTAPPAAYLDPPHAVDSGGCCSNCFTFSQELLRCSACDHAWYCDQACQRAHFKKHKPQCKTLKVFSGLHSDMPEQIRPSNSKEFYVQRITARNLLSKVMGRPLARGEARAVLGEARCSLCMSTRDQAAARGGKLVCCATCHWGWACEGEHAAAYLDPGAAQPGTSRTKGGQPVHTPQVCATYQLLNASQVLLQNMFRTQGKLPSFCPEGPKTAAPTPPGDGDTASAASTSQAATRPLAYMVPRGWERYARWRGLPPLDPPLRAQTSRRLSQALTAVAGLQHHYAREEAVALQRVTVHVVGCGAYEVPADAVWEEVVHLLPWPQGAGCAPARALHVDFIGPEVGDIILEEEDGLLLPKPVCGACSAAGTTRTYAYHMCTYHDFLQRQGGKGGKAAPPTLVIAFNTGMGEEAREMWAPTLKALAASGAPCVFTCYNQGESEVDVAAWKAAGGEVTLGPEENPFRALDPIMEPSCVDEFYYQSYWWFCGRGAGRAGSKA